MTRLTAPYACHGSHLRKIWKADVQPLTDAAADALSGGAPMPTDETEARKIAAWSLVGLVLCVLAALP